MYSKHFLIYVIQNSCETTFVFALCTPKGGIQMVIVLCFIKIFNSKNNVKIGKGRKNFHPGIIAVCFPYKQLCVKLKYVQERGNKDSGIT